MKPKKCSPTTVTQTTATHGNWEMRNKRKDILKALSSIGHRRRWIRNSTPSIVEFLSWKYNKIVRDNIGKTISVNKELDHKSDFKRVIENSFTSIEPTNWKKVVFERWFSPLIIDRRVKRTTQVQQVSSRMLQMEKQFLNEILKDLKTARFHPLSRPEEIYAKGRSYHFSTPISIKWSSMDKKFIGNCPLVYSNSKFKPESGDFALIFHRGVGLHRNRGLFIGQKLNEGIARIYNYLFSPIVEFTSDQASRIKSRFVSDLNNFLMLSKYTINDLQQRLGINETEFKRLGASVEEESETEVEDRSEEIDEALYNALKQQQSLSDLPMRLRYFFRWVTFQEPTFKEVFVLYRRFDPDPAFPDPQTQNRTLSSNQKFLLPELKANSRNIHIRYFTDVPMADLDMVLPFQRAYFRNSDKINFAMMSVLMFSAAIPLLQHSFLSLVDSKAWIATMVAASVYGARLVSRVSTAYFYFNAIVSSVSGTHLFARDSAALLTLMDASNEQLSKEMCVVYYSLCDMRISLNDTNEYWTTAEEIAIRSKDIVQDVCRESKMVDPGFALERLSEQGLVQSKLNSSSELIYKAILPFEVEKRNKSENVR